MMAWTTQASVQGVLVLEFLWSEHLLAVEPFRIQGHPRHVPVCYAGLLGRLGDTTLASTMCGSLFNFRHVLLK